MAKTKEKVTISVDSGLLGQLDELVQAEQFESRSAVIEMAAQRLLEALEDARYQAALDALTPEDVTEMQVMAEEGMADWSVMVSRDPW